MRTAFLAACSLLLSLSALACGGEEFVATPAPEQGGASGGEGDAGSGGSVAGQGGSSAGSGGSASGSGGSDAGAGGSSAGAGGDGQGGAPTGGSGGDGGQGGAPAGGSGGATAGSSGNGGSAGAAGEAGAAGSDAGAGGSAGSGGAPECKEAELLCGGVCVEESAKHCGGCDPCPTPKDDHATASCTGGTCGASCAPGFALAAGRCRDLGGWFVTHQAGDTTQCPSGNGMNSAKCTCPEGFSKAPLGGLPQPGITATGGDAPLLTACVPAVIAGDLTKPAGNWGGAYLREVGTGKCRWGNPYRSDSQCGCPGEGWIEEKIPLKETPNSNELEFYTCRSAPQSGSATFLGSFARYTESAVVGGFLGKNCYAPNALTGECKCPQGSFAVTIQSKFQGNKGTINPISAIYPVQLSLCVPNGL